MPQEDVAAESALNEDIPQNTVDPIVQSTLVADVVTRFTGWKQARSVLEAKWRECWEAYLCDLQGLYTQPDENNADRSRIVRPVLYEAVEAIHSNIMNALFPASERFFSVLGQSEADQANARLIEEFIAAKLDAMNFIEKYGLFLKQAIITGNTVASVPWRRKSRRRRVQQPVSLLGVTIGYDTQWTDDVVYDGPDFEVIDIFDFVLDPDEPDFERAMAIRRVTRSLNELKAAGVYTNLDVLETAGAAEVCEDGNKRSRRQAFGISEASEAAKPRAQRPVELLEAWGDFVVGDTIYENYVCVVANRTQLIRFEPNPYDHGCKPFVFANFIAVPNECYGIGAIEKSLGLQHAINTLTNQKLDVINLSINNPFTYLINDDVFDPDTLVTRPGALIPVKSHDTLRPIQYLTNFTVAFNEIADLKSEAQEATGALKYLTGHNTPDSVGRTATEVNALVNGGVQKFSSIISHLEHTSLEPFLSLVFENARQFVREPQSVRVICAEGEIAFWQVPPQVMKEADCAFQIDGSRGLVLKEQETGAIIRFLQLAQADKRLDGQIDVLALYRKIYRRLGFRDEAQIFLPAPPQPGAANPDGTPKQQKESG